VEGVEAEGRTVNEAIEGALSELGLKRDQVEIEVLSEGRPRLLGFRGEPARVRVTPLATRAGGRAAPPSAPPAVRAGARRGSRRP
jgi:spoIIIJ-associated protein